MTLPPPSATILRPRRSVLYMPGSNARALEKARTLPADGLIFDLEDAVAPDAKETARHQTMEAVTARGFGRREVVVRINGLDTPYWLADLDAAAKARPDGILVPKISTPAHLVAIADRLGDIAADPAIRLWAMIETPAAFLNIREIAALSSDSEMRLSAFVLGLNDLSRETGMRIVPGRAPMLPLMTQCILAARANGVDVLDGVFNALNDNDGFAAECAQARDLGFDGKTLIHPNQIEICNAAFTPADDEIARARRIVAAFDDPANAGTGALRLDGQMVERLHVEMARRTLAVAEAMSETGTA